VHDATGVAEVPTDAAAIRRKRAGAVDDAIADRGASPDPPC